MPPFDFEPDKKTTFFFEKLTDHVEDIFLKRLRIMTSGTHHIDDDPIGSPPMIAASLECKLPCGIDVDTHVVGGIKVMQNDSA